MNFADLIKTMGIDIKMLSARYNIPMRTCYSWLKGERRPPDYLLLILFDIYLLGGFGHGEEKEGLGSGMEISSEGISETCQKG